jgi:tetratricopeptide (TPR) repeat protein
VQEEDFSRQSLPFLDQHLHPALRHLLQARDRCPLLSEVQLQLAVNREKFPQADSRRAYLERVKQLAPDDPEQWYLCGVLELFDEDTERAWASWRHCLELSDRYLANMVGSVAGNPDVPGVLSQILPDRPALWLTAADQLYPGPEAASKRRPLLEKALALLTRPPGPRSAAELHRVGAVQAALGEAEAALASYRLALESEPQQINWRFELASLLCEQRRFSEVRSELLTILATQPGNGPAKSLLETVLHELAQE